VQTVTLDSPSPEQNRFGPAVVNFAGAPDFSPTRIATPGPNGSPLAKFQPGSVAGPGYSPFIKIAGSNVVYNAPIVAVGDGSFDVTHHTNTEDRVLGIHLAPASPQGQFLESYADLLFVKEFDAGQPIVYLSTDAGQPLTAVLERSTYVPALNNASFNGGDDFLGSARERLFGFINGQTGVDNPQSQGFVHLVKDGFAAEDVSAGNTALMPALLGLRANGPRATLALGLLQATSLPFIVTITQIGVALGKITPVTAAALVCAGLLSVLIFPLLALANLRRMGPAPAPAPAPAVTQPVPEPHLM
jgi:hypothetical protein